MQTRVLLKTTQCIWIMGMRIKNTDIKPIVVVRNGNDYRIEKDARNGNN